MKLVDQAAFAVGLPDGIKVEYTGANQRLQKFRSNGVVLREQKGSETLSDEGWWSERETGVRVHFLTEARGSV